MRQPQSSKNDARGANEPDWPVGFQYGNLNGALMVVFAPFRTSSHRIVQVLLAPP